MENTKHNIEIEQFIRDYLRENHTADRLNQDFHEKFTKQFGGKITIYPFGSCPNHLAMRWLKKLYQQGVLSRCIVGIQSHEVGFPNWVYVYELPR